MQESWKAFLGYLSRELNKRVNHETIWVNTVQEKGRAGERCHCGNREAETKDNEGSKYSRGGGSGPSLAESFRPQ